MSRSAIKPCVLHVDDQPGWRGGEQQMLYLARGLQRRQVPTAAVLQRGSAPARMAGQEGIDVRALRMRGEADLEAARHIAKIARAGRFNVLHSHTAHAHTLILLAAHLWLANCKVVAHRRIEYAVGRGMLGLGRLKYRFGTDAYIAISNRLKETLLEAGVPEWKVFVVHSVTDTQRFAEAGADRDVRTELGIPQDAFVVGNIGALVGHKDHCNLLEACRLVRDAAPDTWVVIVGDGPLRGRIRARAQSLQMGDRLIMTGFRQDVPQLIRAFDIFALSSSEEGMCSTLLEAAASECPIVATDAGGVREAVLPDRTGLVVPIRSPAALAEGILQLRRDPQRGREMARRGKHRVETHFNVDLLTERTLEVYERVLRGTVGAQWPLGYCAD